MTEPVTQNPLLLEPSRPAPKHVAIIGAGTIGPDIGYYLLSALPNLRLTLVDIAPEALERAQQRIEGYVRKGLKRRKLSEAQAEQVRAGLVLTLDYAELAGADWVIEAATEDLALKRAIFAEVESHVSPTALITSNTSSLPASRLFGGLEHKGRATVTHFFAPAYRNPAVEVIRWEHGDPEVIDYLRWLFTKTGKVPLTASDALCFMLDRVFDNWCNEAAYLLDSGATAAQVDTVARGLVQAGPFFVLNLANGNPIIVETNTLQLEEGAHYAPAPILRSVDRWNTVPPGGRVAVAVEQAAAISDRLHGVLFSQSFDVLDRRIADPADLNLGCVLALGFRKGPLDVMRDLGAEETARIGARFCDDRPGMPGAARPWEHYQGFDRHVLVDRVGDVGVITLRRPQAMNALNDEVTDEILGVLKRLGPDPALAGFVLVGYGERAFCAGADIGRFPEVLGDAAAAADYARDCARLLTHLDSMDKPVVAALNGMALGGGLELALRCHGIVAHHGARLQLPEVTLGIAPGLGGMAVPYRRWPAAAEVFHDMLLRARKLKAVEALELGIVDALADSYPALIRAACERVRALADSRPPLCEEPVSLAPIATDGAPTAANGLPLSREVVAIIAQAISESAAAGSVAEALEVGYRAFGETACTAAAAEGIAAFSEKRKPDFSQTG